MKSWGSKRTCTKCSARFYDLNRVSGVCPKCDAPFDTQGSTKRKRTRAVSGARAPEAKVEVPESPQPALAPLKEAGKVAEMAINGDGSGGDAALDEIEDIDDSDDEDESLIEDASELGEDKDDMADVIGKVKDEEGRA